MASSPDRLLADIDYLVCCTQCSGLDRDGQLGVRDGQNS